MNFFENLSTRSKLYLGFGFIIVAIVIIIIGSYISLVNIQKSQNKVIHVMRISQNLTQVRSDQNRIRALALDALLAEDKEHRDTILSQIQEQILKVESRVKDIKSVLSDMPEELKAFQDVNNLMLVYRKNREHQIDLIEAGKLPEAKQFSDKEQEPLYLKIRKGTLSIEDNLNQIVAKVEKENNALVENEMTKLILISIFLILASLLLLRWLMNLLRKIFSEIQSGVSVIGTAGAEILTTIIEMSAGASETSAAVSETSVTIEEIRQTATIATQKAQEVLDSSHRATEAAIDGKDSVQKTIEGMSRINQQMRLIAVSVEELAERNRSIGEITSTVSDIADQSNLLAVNAAIEAAKAGEYGRGFTVVAQEIRNLSEQSKRATAQVKELLNEIQRRILQAVAATEKGSHTVEEGSKLATQSGNMIELLADNVNEAAQSVMQISASSQQQMSGMGQIVPAMENIRQASEQNVIGTRQTQAAAQNLTDLGNKLQSVVDKYKI